MNTDVSLIAHKVESRVVQQRIRDGYINATAMCRASGKRFGGYYRLDGTRAFLDALEADVQICTSELVQVVKGGSPDLQGTWVHPQVAIHLAQWLSPWFAVQVTEWVFDWLRGEAVRSYEVAQKIRAYLSPEKREWTKTFPDDLWVEFARLTGHTGSSHRRPKWWGHLVNCLIYDCLDPDVAAHLRENKPTPRRGQNYHQWLTSDHGLPKLNEQRIYGDQFSLDLRILKDSVWDNTSVH